MQHPREQVKYTDYFKILERFSMGK